MIGQARLMHQDLEDLEQELVARLLEALQAPKAPTADPSAFVSVILQKAALDILRYRRAKKRDAHVVSLSKEVATLEGPTPLAQCITASQQPAHQGDPVADEQ